MAYVDMDIAQLQEALHQNAEARAKLKVEAKEITDALDAKLADAAVVDKLASMSEAEKAALRAALNS